MAAGSTVAITTAASVAAMNSSRAASQRREKLENCKVTYEEGCDDLCYVRTSDSSTLVSFWVTDRTYMINNQCRPEPTTYTTSPEISGAGVLVIATIIILISWGIITLLNRN